MKIRRGMLKLSLCFLLATGWVMMAQTTTNTFTLNHALQDGMSLSFRDNESSGGFNIRWTNLLVNAYLDTTNQKVRIIGYAAGTQDLQQISYTTNRAVAQVFPNPPIQVTGSVTVRLALPTGGLFFDTGYRPLTFEQSSGQYTFDGTVLGTIPVVGSCTLVTGGRTYSTNFSYNLNAALGFAYTFSRLSTADYPHSLVLSAFGWSGGMFSYSAGVDTAAEIVAENGFPVTIKPGMGMWGLFSGESFNWSFGAQQGLPGGAGVDITPASAYPGEAPLLPIITVQPASATTTAGSEVAFTVTATGKAPLTYRWQFNGSALADEATVTGSSSNTLTLRNTVTNQAGAYSVVVSNGYGASVTSSVATLTVLPQAAFPPSLVQQPVSQTVSIGSNFVVSVTVTGTPPFAYRWIKDGTNLADGGRITGATNSTLAIADVQPADAGDYRTVVTNAFGAVTSMVATLTVQSPGPITLRVPQDYATIQAAVNAAVAGDTILISDGTYNEHNIVVAKSLTIASMNGPAATVIDN
ncbi:MAG TPA: immunoglobulin domain-containing protein, partial [Candidatus Paceibacterota bacterium]|nr:immunoglobulin domain-containing protein [Candidatus Paceibacterota bacterium]